MAPFKPPRELPKWPPGTTKHRGVSSSLFHRDTVPDPASQGSTAPKFTPDCSKAIILGYAPKDIIFSHINYPGASLLIHNNLWLGYSQRKVDSQFKSFLTLMVLKEVHPLNRIPAPAYEPGGKMGEVKGTCSTFSCQRFLTVDQEKQTLLGQRQDSAQSREGYSLGRQVTALLPGLLIFLTLHTNWQKLSHGFGSKTRP